MRTFAIIIVAIFLCHSCRRADNYPDYNVIKGKWRFVHVQKHDISQPLDSFVKIYPSETYEMDFRKHPKVNTIKNGDCQKTYKIYKCQTNETGSSPTWTLVTVYFKEDDQVRMAFTPEGDTLIVEGFYPYSNEPGFENNDYYVKE